jgi:uncharacterized delta-60 repeat protein
MRGQKTWSMRFVSLLGIALAVGVVLALGSTAASARQVQTGPGSVRAGHPAQFLELDKIEPSAGLVTDVKESIGGSFDFTFFTDLGLAAFTFPETFPIADGSNRVTTNRDGSRFSVLTQSPTPDLTDLHAVRGGISHFEELQAYKKRSGNASLRIEITQAVLRAIDERRDPSGCPPKTLDDCPLLRGIIRFRARAYAASAGNDSGGDFFAEGGVAYLEGHRGHWTFSAATDADSQLPLWDRSSFRRSNSCKCIPPRVGGPAIASDELRDPLTLTVPLDSVRDNELFGVDVTLESEATNDRGGESTSMGFIEDPEHVGPGLLKTRGLKPLGKPKFREPKASRTPGASCPTGPSAGKLQLSRDAYAVTEGGRAPLVLVTRTGGSRGEISATVRTKSGSAKAGPDFKATTTRVTLKNHDTSPRFVEIPVREDKAAEPQESFTVSISHPQCGKLGQQRSASVTILDDDQPPPPPPPTFTIGGTVDGLVGSGLVLTNAGADVPVSGNGGFTFPGTADSGQPFDVEVRAQPTNPTQVCTVQGGKGTVSNANVTDVAVHCAAPLPPPLGLDTSFGIGGFASTPVSGLQQGNAVVIQPTGGIVTAGLRTVGILGHTDFALTRHDEAGNLDHGFGTDGVATTDLGGDSDQALGAALLPDNGIVAVGRTDVRGPQKTDFAVVRYLPDGTLNPNFGNGGIVTTPFAGLGAQANAVAVQPDGKIVVAGFALTNAINFDFAVARYNPDGSLDDNFGAHGIVNTDLGSENDDATGLAIQSDGKIVLAGVAGPTGEDVGLARYLPNGTLDRTFGDLGTSVTKIGFGVDVHGVGIEAGGGILVAGSTFSTTSGNRDFLLAGFRGDGTLNLGFGHFGFVTTDFGHGDDFAQNLLVDANGEIVLVGRAASDTIEDLALAAYHPDGSLADFGRGGIFTVDFHGKGDFGQDLAIDSRNRIVAVGGTTGGDSGLALTRVFR